MKKEDLILFGVVALGVYMIIKTMGTRAAGAAPANNYNTQEIMRYNGWVYYTDGTSIGPDGKYYKSGDLIYDPKGMYQ
ncbi:MAG: hypothetical protein ACJ8LG_21660 [Massilia sp.]